MIDILIGPFVSIYSFETINFAGILEIAVTVSLSVCLNPINTY